MQTAEAEVLSIFCDVCTRMLSPLDLRSRLALITKSATEMLKVKASSIRLLDQEGKRLEIVAAYGLSEGYLKKGPVEVEKSLIDKEALAGEMAMIRDAAQDVRAQYPEEARREGIASILCVPLRVGDRAIGVLRVYAASPHEFSEQEVKIVSALACHGAVAIENARLRDACGSIVSAFDLREALALIVKTATETMNVKASSIRLLDKDGRKLEIAAAYGLSEDYLKKGPVEVEKSLVDKEALANGQATILDATKDVRAQYPDEARREGIASILCVPLMTGDKTIGVIRIYTSTPRPFSEREVDVLTTLARYAASAIESAQSNAQTRKQYDDLLSSVWAWYDYVQRTGHL